MDKNNEELKYEIAGELGLLDKVLKFGWKSLSAKETGRIGGLITKRKKAMEAAGKPEGRQKNREWTALF